MKNNLLRVQAGFLVTIFALTILSTGCEPLRKKFTRKKKEDKGEQFIPVLDPVDYPAKQETPESAYKLHYSLWQGWYKDYITATQDHVNDKKIDYDLNQLLTQGQEMQKILQGEKQQMMNAVLQEIVTVITQYKTPQGVRNDAMLRQQVMSIDKKIRQNLKWEQVQDSLAPNL